MAISLMVAVLERGPSGLADMAVLLAIADSADKDTGEAWPSQRTIAARSRQTDRSVRAVLERLREDGWITWEKRLRGNGSQASNLYTLNLEKLGEGRAARGATPPERRSALEPSHKKEPGAGAGLARPVQRQSRRLPPDGVGASAAPVDAAAAVAKLSPFGRKLVREGHGLLLDGEQVAAGSSRMLMLQAALSDLERGASSRSCPAPAAAAALIGAVARACENKGAGNDARS